MLAALASALAARDPSTAAHCARVTHVASALATWLGWDEGSFDARVGAPSPRHRQGDDLRADPAQARPADRRRARRDPDSSRGRRPADPPGRPGAGRASVRPLPPRALGRRRLSDRTPGPRFREGARLLAVVDAFDAMTSTRPYRRALPTMHALAEIERCAGTQFDPTIAAGLPRRRGAPARFADAAAI